MANLEIEKAGSLEERAKETKPDQESREALSIPELEQQLDQATMQGLEQGHGMLDSIARKETHEFPPELQGQFAEIQKEANGKLRGLDASLGRARERLFSTLNFLTGGLFEKMRRNPAEGKKFFSGYFLDKNQKGISNQERTKLESQINIENIRAHAKEVVEYITNKIRENDVVLLGEIHTHACVEKNAVANMLEQAKVAGVTHVGLELPEYYQEAVDRFMLTGKFADTDDPADYEQVDEYHRLFREQLRSGHHPDDTLVESKLVPTAGRYGKYEAVKPEGMTDAMFAFEQKMRAKKNFVFRNHFDKDYYLLKKIREAGLSAVCLDANATYGTNPELDDGLERGTTMVDLRAKEAELESERDVFMTQKIKGVIAVGGKMLSVLGGAHVARGGMRGGTEDRENVADLLGRTDYKTSSISIDRDCDRDAELTYYKQEAEDESSSNSILYSRISHDAELSEQSFGVDLSSDIVQSGPAAPYDGYVHLA